MQVLHRCSHPVVWYACNFFLYSGFEFASVTRFLHVHTSRSSWSKFHVYSCIVFRLGTTPWSEKLKWWRNNHWVNTTEATLKTKIKYNSNTNARRTPVHCHCHIASAQKFVSHLNVVLPTCCTLEIVRFPCPTLYINIVFTYKLEKIVMECNMKWRLFKVL